MKRHDADTQAPVDDDDDDDRIQQAFDKEVHVSSTHPRFRITAERRLVKVGVGDSRFSMQA